MESVKENKKINPEEFKFLSNMVDYCIESFLSGDHPKECFNKIRILSANYRNQLSEERISELLNETEKLFISYFNLLGTYNQLIEKETKLKEEGSYDINLVNFFCKEYIKLRNKIILATENMLSHYYLDLEKNIIRQLQKISNQYDLYKKSEGHIKK